jgi:hypothetical protein
MRHRKGVSTSGVPGRKRSAAEDESAGRKRPEGTVTEHKTRMKRNHDEKSSSQEYGDSVHDKK